MNDELIRRKDVIKITWQEPSYYDPLNVLTEVRERVKALPTVDAVKVVRCAECRWADWYTTKRGKFCHCLETEKRGLTETDYCSFGEKMVGEEQNDE